MSDKMRDPKTGRFVKSGTELSVPVRDSDDVVIENLRERLGDSARRVHDLEKIINDQDILIDQLQRDPMLLVNQLISQDEVIDAARAKNREIAAVQYVADKALFEEWAKEDEEVEVPAPKRGYRLIAWGLVFGGCILFWYGVGQFFLGGK